MLAAVFFCQPLGQLIAVLMAFAATAGFRGYISTLSNDSSCSVVATNPGGPECARTVDRAWRLVAGLGAVPAVVAMVFRLTIPESVYYTLDIKNDSNEAMHAKEYFGSSENLGHGDQDSVHVDDFEHNPKTIATGQHVATGLQIPEHAVQSHSQGERPSNESATNSVGPMVQELEDPHPSQASRADLYKYLFTDGNWTDLFATSVNWMLLDFTFYLLGVNSSSFVPRMFGQASNDTLPPYSWLINNERHIMESTSIGALIGSAIAIVAMHLFSRRRIQVWGFLILGGLFIIVGALYITLPSTNAHVAIVVFYGICQLFYNLGTFLDFPLVYECSQRWRDRSKYYYLHCKFSNVGKFLMLVVELTPSTDPSRSIPNPLPLHTLRNLRRQRQTRLRLRPSGGCQSPEQQASRHHPHTVKTPPPTPAAIHFLTSRLDS